MAKGISYSLPEAAIKFKINYHSLLSYVKKGVIDSFDVSMGTRPIYRVWEHDMEKFLEGFDRTKKSYRVVPKPEPKSVVAPVAVIKQPIISDLTRRQLEMKNDEIAHLKSELKQISAELMDLLIKLDELAQ